MADEQIITEEWRTIDDWPFEFSNHGHVRLRTVEKWLPVSGWPYDVSDLGRVRRSIASSSSRAGLVLRPSFSVNGYMRVCLSNNGMRVYESVHRLVCKAFHGPEPTGFPYVAHWDGNKLNNRATNLRWTTPKENGADDSWRLNERSRGETHHKAKLTESEVREILLLAQSGTRNGVLAMRFGLNRHQITMIVKGRSWRHITCQLEPPPEQAPRVEP